MPALYRCVWNSTVTMSSPTVSEALAPVDIWDLRVQVNVPPPAPIAHATVNASRTFDVFRDRGTLNVGAVAEMALLELRDGNSEVLDNYGNKIPGRQRLFPSGTVLGGKRIPRA